MSKLFLGLFTCALEVNNIYVVGKGVNKMADKILLTIPQMAERMQISARKAYELKQRPGFPFYNLGQRQTRVVWDEVQAWVKRESISS